MKLFKSRSIAAIVALVLCFCALNTRGGASSDTTPAYLEVGGTLLTMYQQNPEAPFWELTEEQQNGALLLMAAGLLSQQEAYGAPDTAIAERIAEQAADNDLLILAMNLWQDDQQYMVPFCDMDNDSAILDIQCDEQVNLIQRDGQGQWVTLPPLFDQRITLPPNVLFIYFYPGENDVAFECISRTPSTDGYIADPATDPDAMIRRSDRLRCGHPVGSTGKHGRIITCGRYVCEDNHGSKHELAPCGIKGHYLCDNKDHAAGVCTGVPLSTAAPQPELEACGQPAHTRGTEGDHTIHLPCGQWHCVGEHAVPPCGNHEHCAMDGKSHAALACKKHFACDSGGSDCDHSAPQEDASQEDISQESTPQESAPQE